MTWARLDDQMCHSLEWVKLADAAARKVAATAKAGADLAELTEAARRATLIAKFTHMATLAYAVPALTDGKITPADIQQVCARGSLTPDEWMLGAELLVDTGAWRTLRPSKRDPLGGWEMRLSWAPGEQPLRADEKARKQRQNLRDALRQGRKDYPKRVAAEKRAAGQCEYCDRHVGTAGQIDHVDPNRFTNAVENLAVACNSCNSKKGMHTLEEVGMAFTKRALDARRSTRSTTKATST